MFFDAQSTGIVLKSLPVEFEGCATVLVKDCKAAITAMLGRCSRTRLDSFLFRCEMNGGSSDDGYVVKFNGVKSAKEWKTFTTNVALSNDGDGVVLR